MLLVGRGFLSMLNTLDRGDLLKPASKIKDISLVMALYLRVFQLFRDSYFELEDAMWAMHVISYADKHGIKISGPHNTEKHIEAIKSLCADAVDDNGRAVGFPRAGVDRWRWKKQVGQTAFDCRSVGQLRRNDAVHRVCKGIRHRPQDWRRPSRHHQTDKRPTKGQQLRRRRSPARVPTGRCEAGGEAVL